MMVFFLRHLQINMLTSVLLSHHVQLPSLMSNADPISEMHPRANPFNLVDENIPLLMLRLAEQQFT